MTLDLQGSTTIATSDSLYVGQGAQAVNTGTLTLDSNSILYGQCGQAATASNPAIPAGEFVNTGSVVVAAAAAFTAQWGYPNYNYCLVTNDSGSTSIGAGDALQIGGGNYNINAERRSRVPQERRSPWAAPWLSGARSRSRCR